MDTPKSVKMKKPKDDKSLNEKLKTSQSTLELSRNDVPKRVKHISQSIQFIDGAFDYELQIEFKNAKNLLSKSSKINFVKFFLLV